jgi:GH18 family chitinase
LFLVCKIYVVFLNVKVTNWSQYRPEATKYTPANIDPFLCTHIIYAFAALNTTTYEIRAFEWNDESKNEKMGKILTNFKSFKFIHFFT